MSLRRATLRSGSHQGTERRRTSDRRAWIGIQGNRPDSLRLVPLAFHRDQTTADPHVTRAWREADDCVTFEWLNVRPRRSEAQPRLRSACPSGARRPRVKHGAAGRSARLLRSCRAGPKSSSSGDRSVLMPMLPCRSRSARLGAWTEGAAGMSAPRLDANHRRCRQDHGRLPGLPMGPVPQAAEETHETAGHPECADADHDGDRNRHDDISVAPTQSASPDGRGALEKAFAHAGPDLGNCRDRNGRN